MYYKTIIVKIENFFNKTMLKRMTEIHCSNSVILFYDLQPVINVTYNFV